MLRWNPPRLMGGPAMDVHLLRDLFHLKQLWISHTLVLDELDRSLGVYEADRRGALARTWNPFWWLQRGLSWLGRIPFRVLRAVGINTTRLEGTGVGSVIGLVTALAALAAALLTIGNEIR